MRMWSEAVKARSLYSHLFLPSPPLQLSKLPPLLLLLDGVLRPGPLRLFCKKTQAWPLIRPETKINWAAGSSSAFLSLFVCLFHTPARRLIWARLVIGRRIWFCTGARLQPLKSAGRAEISRAVGRPSVQDSDPDPGPLDPGPGPWTLGTLDLGPFDLGPLDRDSGPGPLDPEILDPGSWDPWTFDPGS